MFKAKDLVLFSVFLAGIICLVTIAPENVDADNSEGTWEFSVEFMSSDGLPDSVQFAVFDENPVPGFKERLMTNLTGTEEMRINNPKFGTWYRSQLLADFWDFGFKAVTGDKVYLISDSYNSLMKFVIEAETPKAKKWIVTKGMQTDGGAVCWCIPVELETGKNIKVILSVENTFDIQSAYNQAVAQSVGETQ